MFEFITKFADRLDRITRFFCAMLVAGFFGLMLAGVVLRQVFASGSVILQDLSAYCFAVLVMLSVPVALAANRHVRVDILTRWWSPRANRFLQFLSFWVFLLPVCLLILVQVFPDLIFSWKIREGSGEPEGLGGYFLVKSVLPLAFIFLILQGFVHGYRAKASCKDLSE